MISGPPAAPCGGPGKHLPGGGAGPAGGSLTAAGQCCQRQGPPTFPGNKSELQRGSPPGGCPPSPCLRESQLTACVLRSMKTKMSSFLPKAQDLFTKSKITQQRKKKCPKLQTPRDLSSQSSMPSRDGPVLLPPRPLRVSAVRQVCDAGTLGLGVLPS